MKFTLSTVLFTTFAAALASGTQAFASNLVVEPKVALRTDALRIRAEGLTPNSQVTVTASTQDASGQTWSSSASFATDARGHVNLASASPLPGSSYNFVETMGLIWSMTKVGTTTPGGDYFYFPQTEQIQFTLQSGGKVLNTQSITLKSYDDQKVTKVSVTGQPFVGTYFKPNSASGRLPAILVFSGSDGGLTVAEDRAALYSSYGFTALAIAYFGVPTLPKNLERVPLEYFLGAMKWLKSQSENGDEGVFVSGVSKGGESALLLGATYPDQILGVVADSPSAFVWQSIVPPSYATLDSSWTLNGTDVPYLPYQFLPNDFAAFPVALTPVYTRSSAGQDVNTSPAAIAVEKIQAPILLTSGGDDQCWPSTSFSNQVVQRLNAHGITSGYLHLDYPQAGHLLYDPFQPTTTSYFGFLALGGTMQANGEAARDHWNKTAEFLLNAAFTRRIGHPLF